MVADDDALRPLRRSPRAALREQQAARNGQSSQRMDHSKVPSGVPPSRSASLEDGPEPPIRHRMNPLASHPITPTESPGVTDFDRHKFSHPFWEELKPIQIGNSKPILSAPPPPPPPPVRRSPAGLKSYRGSKRLPLHIRRQPSLETIVSVATARSVPSDDEEPDSIEARAPSPKRTTLGDLSNEPRAPVPKRITLGDLSNEPIAPSAELFTLRDHPSSTPVPSDAHLLASSIHAWSINSQLASNTTTTPAVAPVIARADLTIMPVHGQDQEAHSPKSLFRKMTSRKQSEPSSTPDRLVIERKVSFDRISHHSDLASSIASPSSERPSTKSGLCDTTQSRSSSSSGWSASNFDMSTLSEAEIKKCKKKGINPALYAEMKAAKGGKWNSPIAGNSFL
jgi:hypothetical protein